MMKKHLISFGVILLISFVNFTAYADDDNPINKTVIIKIIQESINKQMFFEPVKIGKKSLPNFDDRVRYIQTAGMFKGLGLISCKEQADGSGTIINLESELTELGKKNPYIKQGEDVYFILGENVIDEIISIEKGKKNEPIYVYFTFDVEPGEAIQAWATNNKAPQLKKAKGMAKLTYDVFIKSYHFKGFKYGSIGEENWGNGAWIDKTGYVRIGFID